LPSKINEKPESVEKFIPPRIPSLKAEKFIDGSGSCEKELMLKNATNKTNNDFISTPKYV
jgi:hypothetical protein